MLRYSEASLPGHVRDPSVAKKLPPFGGFAQDDILRTLLQPWDYIRSLCVGQVIMCTMEGNGHLTRFHRARHCDRRPGPSDPPGKPVGLLGHSAVSARR